MTIKLVGNLISGVPYYNYGHLQIVYDNGVEQKEVEVQAPGTATLGYWQYPDFGIGHTESTNYNVAGKYASTTLLENSQSEKYVWELLGKIHAEFIKKGRGINYDMNQNSNSYINTLLYMIGIDLTSAMLAKATPTQVTDGFPGSNTNVVLNDVAFSFNLTLTKGNDYIRTGKMDDIISGGGGNDTIDGGDGIDTLLFTDITTGVLVDLSKNSAVYTGSLSKVYNIENATGGSAVDYLIGDYKNNTLIGGGSDDTLTGGAGNDKFIINTGEGIDTITDPEAGDRVVYNGVTIEDRAYNLENGYYKLPSGFALQKQGNDLYITSNGTSSGVTVKDFFKGYDDTKDYTMMGITIPADKHDPDDPNNRLVVVPSSPIVLDLNGDGLQFVSYNSTSGKNAHFDIDNDGFAEGMEWLSPNDGFLVRDTNGNGKIDNQKEMFGDDSGTTAYYKLAQLDNNHDNKIDVSDTGFANLRVWQDGNGNGRTDNGELKTLSSLNIKNLSLQLTNSTSLNGQSIAGTSSFTRTDGTVGNAADVFFDTHQIDSIYVGADSSPPLDITTLFLPLSHGYGTLPALQYAMTQNSTLKTMVSNLANLNVGTQMHEVYDRINAIILEWGGATNLGSGGSEINKNAAKYQVLVRFLDRPDVSIPTDENYGNLFNNMASKLLMQGTLHSIFPVSYYNYETDELILNQTNDQIIAKAKNFVPTNSADKFVYWSEISRILHASTNPVDTNLDAKIKLAAGFDAGFAPNIVGTNKDDIIHSGGNGVIQGLEGNDKIYILSDNKIIYNIGDGSDTLLWNSYTTFPKISEIGISDGIIIYFGSGITFDSLVFKDDFFDLIIGTPGNGSITINLKNSVQELHFADGTVKNYADINYKMFAGTGNDFGNVIYGTVGNDVINGLNGNDTIYSGAGNDVINAGLDNDIIYGGAGADKINGGSGNDTVDYSNSTIGVDFTMVSGNYATGDAFTSIENIIGTLYNDVFLGDPFGIKYNGSSGINTISYANSAAGVTVSLDLVGNQISAGDASDDILSRIQNITGSGFADILTGDSNNNILSGGVGNDRLNGGAGNDTLTGGTGADVFVIQKSAGSNDIITDFSPTTSGEYIDLLGFTNLVDFAHLAISQSGSNTIIALENSQIITLQNIVATSLTAANFGTNWFLNGTSGNDIIRGTSGADTISGLGGNDKIIGDFGADTIDGGVGIDTIYYSDSTAGVNVNLILTSSTAQTGGYAAGDKLANIENVTGSAFVDTLTANATGSTLDGGDGNDTLNGGAGNDIIIGGKGYDIINGGAGIDTASYASSLSAVIIFLWGTQQFNGDAQGDQLTNIENIIGSNFNDTIAGNSGANTIDGIGGIDMVSYASSNAAVNINLALGTASGGYATGDVLYNFEDINGSAYDDTLTGSNTDGTIYGLAGNDTINGGIGNDILIGGTGGDTINGGAGIDTVFYGTSNAGVNVNLNLSSTTAQSGGDAQGDKLSNVENITGSSNNDTLAGNSGANTINGVDGVDTVSYASSNAAVNINLALGTASGGFANGDILLNIENIIGSAFTDTLTGNDGDNTLTGGVGADTLNGGNGIDTASYSASSVGVTVNLTLATQSGGDAAGDILSNIENVTGSAFADTITANATGSTLSGLAGNDILNGGNGNDILIGGTGADTINGGAGFDLVSYATSSAGVNVNLGITTAQLGGDAAGDILSNIENITGSALNDILTGDSKNNILSGGMGVDKIDGGSGIDTASYIDSDSSVLVDLVANTTKYLFFTGTGTIVNVENIIGSAYNDTLIGNSGANTLDGGKGDDTITGGSGADVFIMRNDAYYSDIITDFSTSTAGEYISLIGFNNPVDFAHLAISQSGSDAIISLENYQTITLKNVVASSLTAASFGQSSNISGTSGNDVLFGTSGIDTLNGFSGDDTLIGGIGADKLDGGIGIDTASYIGSAAGVNVNLSLTTAQSGGDAAGDILSGIENLTGSAFNDTLTGNSYANNINGGAGNDILNGGVGNDTVTGGLGADIFTINKDASSSDIITDFSTTTAGEYISLLGFTNPVNFASLAISQSGSDTIISLENSQKVILKNILATSLTAASFGGVSSTAINGNAGNDVLNGTIGADTINGLAGDDTINGSAGADIIDGGLNIDTVSYSGSAVAVAVNLSLTTAQSGGDAQGDILSNIENITGSAFADTLTALAIGSTLTGGVGNDILNGGNGIDTLIGGAGADTINGGAGIDFISYATSGAAVNINLALTTAQSGGDAQGDILSNIENIIGSSFADTLSGNSVANNINGGAGIDTVSYANSTAGVNVNLTLATAQTGGYAVGDILSGIENVTGSAFNDTLTALATGSTLDGGAGNDILGGGNGNDMLIGGTGVDTINGGAGIDTVSYATSSGGVNIDIALTTAQSWSDAQGDILSNIENIIGSSYGDTLNGNAVENVINGGDGNDTIYSKDGNDTVSGGNGDDTLDAGIGNDTVHGDAGNDTIYGQDGDDTLYGDAGNDVLWGMAGNNILIGGAGADSLYGFSGTSTASYSTSATGVNVNLATNINTLGDAAGDLLYGINNIIGSAYNDTFAGNSAGNNINGGAGIDLISYATSGAAVNVNLGITTAQSGGDAQGDLLSNIENLTGSGFNDTLLGTSIANIIAGGAGKDTMTGGAGADVFKYSAVTDSGAATGARDIITDFVNGTDKIDLGDFAGSFTFKGTGAFTGTAHEVNYAQVSGNTIIGIDADGNGVLDFQVELAGLHTMTASDFLL